MNIRLGRVNTQSIGISYISGAGAGVSPELAGQFNAILDMLYDLMEEIKILYENQNALIDFINRGVVAKWHVTDLMIIPVVE